MKGRETSICGCLLHAPLLGTWPTTRHVPWLGIESVTLWFTGWHSVHWTTPARAVYWFLRARAGEREREKDRCEGNMNWSPSCMCPDRELNPQPFSVWEVAPTNRATRPGLKCSLFLSSSNTPVGLWLPPIYPLGLSVNAASSQNFS